VKAFHAIAVPHRDILEGRLTMDVFAADLWEVAQNRGSEEYRDSATFFRKTYLTENLKELLAGVEKRLRGNGGDSVIQLQTPFGGGKTHSLIALYHKAKEWGSKTVVIDGTTPSVEQDTLWGMMEKQLSGEIKNFAGKIAPGKEALRKLIEPYQPLLILMDEIHEYTMRAAGVIVEGQNTLAEQTTAFLMELTGVVGTLPQVCLLFSLPASLMEHVSPVGMQILHNLQNIVGRKEKIISPVQENEISKIIRKRLFQSLKENEALEVIETYLDYICQEGILPAGMERTEFRRLFLDSYPFLPEVVDVLYKRWGSYSSFQRTRGVLRLLSLVIHSLKDSQNSYISLADFDLSNQDIRQELVKHIGPEYNGIIAEDITDPNSGAKQVDRSLGSSYKGLQLATRVANATFMRSFSGGQVHGSTSNEIKLSATTINNPVSEISVVVESLRKRLFFLQEADDRYYFCNQPNLNKVLFVKMENVDPEGQEMIDEEKEYLAELIRGGNLKTYLWEDNPANIPDTEELKLIMLNHDNPSVMKNIIDQKGQTPRVNQNTIIFLYPLITERSFLIEALRKKIAYQRIENDPHLALSEEQKKQVRDGLKKAEGEIRDNLRKVYRQVAIPAQDGLRFLDLGIPVYGLEKKLNDEVYDKLKSDGEIVDKIAPLVIKERYLTQNPYVLTEGLYLSLLRTPGEMRPTSKSVIENAISEGVNKGSFGLGEIENGKAVCRFFKESVTVALYGEEIILREDLCVKSKPTDNGVNDSGFEGTGEKNKDDTIESGEITTSTGNSGNEGKIKDAIHLKFQIPDGKVSDVTQVIRLIKNKFKYVEIEISALKGQMTESEYENTVEESFRQLGIELKK
jgi:regulator of replication initiation timing